jgi:predicted N-acetyltransferase YhbS
VRIDLVRAADVLGVRQAVLRPGQPLAAAVMPGDDHEETLHVVATIEDRVVGVGSVIREPYPDAAQRADWRVRGMATLPAMRGRGVGNAILRRCVRHAGAAGGDLVWCAARVSACGFYERENFMAAGEQFIIARIGPHYLMYRMLSDGSQPGPARSWPG